MIMVICYQDDYDDADTTIALALALAPLQRWPRG